MSLSFLGLLLTLIFLSLALIVSPSLQSISGAPPGGPKLGTSPLKPLPSKSFLPYGISVDIQTDQLFVVDAGHNRITELDNNLNYLRVWAYVPGIGTFKYPYDIALDSSSQEIYVTDSGNSKVKKFKLEFPCPANTIEVITGICFVIQWGGSGTDVGRFDNPRGIAVDSSTHEVYVADLGNNRVQKFKLETPCPINTKQILAGVCFVTKWGELGIDDGKFLAPNGIAVDESTHEVYVADQGNDRIQKFNNIGTFLTDWGDQAGPPGVLVEPYGVALDPTTHDIYVADENPTHTIKKYKLEKPCPNGTTTIKSGVCFITEWGSDGGQPGQFGGGMFGIAVDPSSSIFVSDFSNNRIQKFDGNLAFISKWPK